jgi:uncharacterized protein with FMN-binding domain
MQEKTQPAGGMEMKRWHMQLLALVFVLGYGAYLFFYAPILRERNAVRNIEWQELDLSAVPDGRYRGEFGEGSHLYVVEVTVERQRITAVEIVQNRDSEHARRAEKVVERVIGHQSLEVDAVAGATTTSKALLKAMENALLQVGKDGSL